MNSSKILISNKYFVVSCHREENVDASENLLKIIETINNIAEKYKIPIIFSTHPRTRKKIAALKIKTNSLIKFMKPFGFFDYIKLQLESKCVLSDSGTITEESSILNFPALNLREVNERPEGFEEGAVMMVGLKSEIILQCLEVVLNQARNPDRSLRMVSDYTPENVSEVVIRIILSYTDYVNKTVWKKY